MAIQADPQANADLRDLILEFDNEDTPVPQRFLSTEQKAILSLAKSIGLVETHGEGFSSTVTLTKDGKVALVNLIKPPKTKSLTKNENNTNQENVMKAEKTTKKTGNSLPTYGLKINRTSKPSARWTVIDALMKLTKPTTAATVAERLADKMPRGGKHVLAHVNATAAWMVDNGIKGFVGLEASARKAPAPKVKKASKPKVKAKKLKTAAAGNGDILG